MATDYKIVKDKKLADLETKVLTNIASGWTPQGGVTQIVHESDGECFLVQALIKP